MAMTAAERKRLQVERDRAQARKQADLTYALPRPAFGAWLDQTFDGAELQHLDICYDGMNRIAPNFSVDRDPVSATGAFVFPTDDKGEISFVGSLGRAELEVELLLEAAKTLATMVNAYKRRVLADRLHQIETEELNDPETRRARMNEVVMLTKALERLDKSVRTEVPQWQLRG